MPSQLPTHSPTPTTHSSPITPLHMYTHMHGHGNMNTCPLPQLQPYSNIQGLACSALHLLLDDAAPKQQCQAIPAGGIQLQRRAVRRDQPPGAHRKTKGELYAKQESSHCSHQWKSIHTAWQIAVHHDSCQPEKYSHAKLASCSPACLLK